MVTIQRSSYIIFKLQSFTWSAGILVLVFVPILFIRTEVMISQLDRDTQKKTVN